MMPTAPRRYIPVVAALLLTIGLLACRPELVVRFVTTVYEDGSVARILELRGAPGNTEELEDDWLADAGIHIESLAAIGSNGESLVRFMPDDADATRHVLNRAGVHFEDIIWGDRVEVGVPLIRVCDISSNEFDDSDLYTITEELV